ncbi:MAG: dihydropteroate synthase [Bdellovibrionales bacterium]
MTARRNVGSAKDHFSAGPYIMGVVNVTPDSFSDGGHYYNVDKAIEHGLQLLDEGADILDIGGESTRPGADIVDVDEEIQRVVPVIKALREHARFISIDTRNSRTMCAAIDAGANIINDISGLTYDPESINVAAQKGCMVMVMHSQGTPQNMQNNPSYNNVVDDVYTFLDKQIERCKTHRIDPNMLIIDPGIGFGKTLQHNVLLLRYIEKFHHLGVPLLLGTSRKSFIGKLSVDEPAHERLAGSISSALWGLSQGVQIFRVHDVKETKQAFSIFNAIRTADQII